MTTSPKNVVWLSGMPRSGTTWLSQIFASSPRVRLKFCPLFSYDFKNLLDENSSSEDWSNLFREVFHRRSEYLDQDYLRKKGLVPFFAIKDEEPSHLVIKSTRFHNLVPRLLDRHKTIRFVHLVRDPRAAIHSWLTNPYEFPKDADPNAEWRRGICRTTGPGEFWGFDAWKHVNLQAIELEKKYPDRFRIWSYEDLTADAETCVAQMFGFCRLDAERQTIEFLRASQRKDDPNKRSVFKKQNGQARWKEDLAREIALCCEREVLDTPLSRFLRE
jgi:hypothetical protein